MDFHRFFHESRVRMRRLSGGLKHILSRSGLFLLFFVVIGLSPERAAAWPTSAQPAVWLDQPVVPTILAGLALLLLFFGGWYLLSRRWSRMAAKNNTLPPGIWPRLVHVTSTSATFEELLAAILRVLEEYFQADNAIAVKYSRSKQRLFPVAANWLSQDELDALARADISRTIFQPPLSSGRVTVVPGRLGQHKQPNKAASDPYWLTIPVVHRREAIAIIALAGKSIGRFDTGLRTRAEVLKEYISLAAGSFLSAALGTIHRESGYKAEMLAGELAGVRGLEQGLGKIVDVLRQACPVDFVSISRWDSKSGNELRWSARLDHGKLVERHYPVISGDTEEGRPTAKTVEPVIEDDILAVPGSPKSIEARHGMRSRLRVPLAYGGKRLATLTVAHKSPGVFDEWTSARLMPLARVLGEWLQVKDTERVAVRLDGYLDMLDRLESLEDRKCDDITGMLRQAMGVTMIRLFRYDPVDQSFSLASSSFVRPTGEKGNVCFRSPADRLPWHRFALDSRRACLIDQSDPERLMPTEESRLAMVDRFKTGLLMPIYREERDLGVLTVAEMRHPARRRFEGADYVFLRGAASRIGGLLNGHEKHELPRVEKSPVRQVTPLMASSLTTIYGSIDLIRQNGPDLGQPANRYLNNIERAAERIKEVARETDAMSFGQSIESSHAAVRQG